MSVHARARRLIWTRRAVQVAVLALFVVLLAANRPTTGGDPDAPVGLFFDLDPLVMVASWFSTHTLAGISLLGLIAIGLTLVLGRVFCGWFCPLGTLHNAVGSLRDHFRRVTVRVERYSKWQRGKYYVVAALLLMALLGVNWIGVLDPFSLLYRSLALTVVPALDVATGTAANAIYMGDPHLGPLHLRDLSEPVYVWWREHVTATELRVFSGAGLIFVIFLTALALNLVRNRFWCRYVCPLGGLLGAVSVRPLLRLTSRDDACNGCGKCALSCPAAAQPEKPDQWLATECFGCWNCVGACRNGALDFTWHPPGRRTSSGSVDVGKRRLVTALAAGAGAAALMRMTPQAHGKTYDPALIRPPGARDEHGFLQRCVQCGLCMQVCPTAALQPAWNQAGLEGLWTPVLVPAIGWCEFECHACGQVCPTEAIRPLPLDDKKKVKIGLAVIDTTRCLPYAYDRECIVCEEHCPIPTKAITFELREAVLRDGSRRQLKFPVVDADLCTGCGICETKCPFQDLAAIRVTSAGEDRHPGNQPVLTGGTDPYGETFGY